MKVLRSLLVAVLLGTMATVSSAQIHQQHHSRAMFVERGARDAHGVHGAPGGWWGHGRWHGYVGIYWDWWPWYAPWSPWYYGYAWPVYSPEAAAPTEYVEMNPAGSADASAPAWYFCANPQGYYPYVKECQSGWQKVAPQPPKQ